MESSKKTVLKRYALPVFVVCLLLGMMGMVLADTYIGYIGEIASSAYYANSSSMFCGEEMHFSFFADKDHTIPLPYPGCFTDSFFYIQTGKFASDYDMGVPVGLVNNLFTSQERGIQVRVDTDSRFPGRVVSIRQLPSDGAIIDLTHTQDAVGQAQRTSDDILSQVADLSNNDVAIQNHLGQQDVVLENIWNEIQRYKPQSSPAKTAQ